MDVVGEETIRFCDLSDELLVSSVMPFLDARSTARLAQCCRRHHALEQIHIQLIWETRVDSQYGKLHLEEGTTRWKDVARNLWKGVGEYVGFAVDRWTNNFCPYPMELSVREATPSIIHWKSLGDSMTRLEVSCVNKTEDLLLDRIEFTEVELLQGENILIPNPYSGKFFGSIIVGIYPLGSFFLVRTDALTGGRLDHDKRDAFPLYSNCRLEGTIVVPPFGRELSQREPPQCECHPAYFLIKKELPKEQLRNLAPLLGPSVVSCDRLLQGEYKCRSDVANLYAVVNDRGERNENSDVTLFMVRSLSCSSVVDCWYVGNNRLVGVARNLENQRCGSLVLQPSGGDRQPHKSISRRAEAYRQREEAQERDETTTCLDL